MDITHTRDLGATRKLQARTEKPVKFPQKPIYNESLTPLLEQLNQTNLYKVIDLR